MPIEPKKEIHGGERLGKTVWWMVLVENKGCALCRTVRSYRS
jgi:hypothetical protein